MTDAIQKITAAASQGLTRAEVIATVLNGRALTAEEQVAFDKARGIWKLREAKRKAEKKAAGPMTGAERVAKHRNAAQNIDRELAEARGKIDHKRREAAEKSLVDWIKTYCVGVLINDPPPEPHGVKILREMGTASESSQPYQILVARGGGKTSYTECLIAYTLSTGRRRFCVISSLNATQAKQILRETTAIFTSEPFATDYPDIALPIILLDGHGKRSQRQGGHDTKVHLVAEETLLPTITNDDGTPTVGSGACIRAKALKSVRGTKNGTQRPDLIVLDDLQITELANNEERVAETLALIRGDVMGLAGKEKAAIISTATTIAPDDLTVQIERDVVWRTIKNPAILRWPKEWEKDAHGLWGEYYEIYKHENVQKLKHTRRGGSLDFYRAHRKQMDAGADILNWNYYEKKDGQISGLQKLLDKYLEMGHAAFMAEYQMEPQTGERLYTLTPSIVVSRTRPELAACATPQGAVMICAATDINPSYALSTAVVAFDGYHTSTVMDYFLTPCKISGDVNDLAFSTAVYNVLGSVISDLRTRGIDVKSRSFFWGCDASGNQKTAALKFADHARRDLDVQAHALMGTQEARFNPRAINRKYKYTPGKNGTVLLIDNATRLEFIRFDKDMYEESAQRAWLSEIGAPGGCTIFGTRGGEVCNHDEFAIQVCNETIKAKILAGEFSRYTWKEHGKHDLGDAVYMCHALAGFNGLSAAGNDYVRVDDASDDDVVFL